MQSELRRPQRWRGRVRSPFAGWSVFVGVVVAILFGAVFWASVWLMLSPSTSVGSVATSDEVEESVPLDDLESTLAVDPDSMDEADIPSVSVAAYADDEDVAAYLDDEDVAAYADDDIDAVAEGPLYGPFEPVYGPVEVADGADEAAAEAAALNDSGEPAPAKVADLATKAEEITARAGAIAAKAEEFATRAEEFAVRIEGLTARIDELEAKLQASDAAVTARLASVVPSPVATPRTSETVARAGQTTIGTRAPWVITPQPGPGSRVAAGPLVLETRARGEAPIARIHLVLDGVALPVSVERRDDKNWQGRAATRVSPGEHTVAVSVVDTQGRTGSYRWQFAAGQ